MPWNKKIWRQIEKESTNIRRSQLENEDELEPEEQHNKAGFDMETSERTKTRKIKEYAEKGDNEGTESRWTYLGWLAEQGQG